MPSKIKLIIVLCLALLLFGCKTIMYVHDIEINKLAAILKDYAGLHGYTITYQNDQTGSYRLSLGLVYMPNTTEAVKTERSTQQIPTPVKNDNTSTQTQTLTSYEETTWRTVSTPGHYVEASVMVRISQQDGDAQIILDSNDNIGSSLSDLFDYIKDLGYKVEYK